MSSLSVEKCSLSFDELPRSLLETHGDFVLVCSSDASKLIYINASARTFLGWAVEELADADWIHHLVTPNCVGAFRVAVARRSCPRSRSDHCSIAQSAGRCLSDHFSFALFDQCGADSYRQFSCRIRRSQRSAGAFSSSISIDHRQLGSSPFTERRWWTPRLCQPHVFGPAPTALGGRRGPH